MRSIDVQAESPYTCWIGSGVREKLAAIIDGRRAAVLYPAVLRSLADSVVSLLPNDAVRLEVSEGEAAKNVGTLHECWNQLAAAQLTRSDVIIGVGGGATTDLAGFVASTWLRGVAYVSVPTTVLAMVDAAVGGKTGIDLDYGKNLVGSFYEPEAVLADLDLLASLPPREIVSGFAEIIKAGFVSEESIFSLITENPTQALDITSDRFAQLVYEAIAFKARVVTDDLRESTSVGSDIGRELLNYGHTFAHAIEQHEQYGLRHGEAVSIGMMYVALLSQRVLGLDDTAVAIHRDTLTALGLPVSYSGADWQMLRDYMSRDKKTRGATLRFVGLEALGKPRIIEAPKEEILQDCYEMLGN